MCADFFCKSFKLYICICTLHFFIFFILLQDNRDNPATLAFWMANASEILHFFKQDRDVHPFSQDSQEMLAEAVQMAFHHLVHCLQYDLQRTLYAFIDENDDDDEIGTVLCIVTVIKNLQGM